MSDSKTVKKYKKIGKGTLFINNYKKQDSHPDRTGSLEIDGVEYRLAGWDSTTVNNDEYISMSVSVEEVDNGNVSPEEQSIPDRPAKQEFSDGDDGLPF